MRNHSSRRRFIATVAAAGVSSGLAPLSLYAAGTSISNEQRENETPKVFLFQGDSITDGNRGRNADSNHIMGHGYVFSIASRIGADFPSDGFTFYNRGISGKRIE